MMRRLRFCCEGADIRKEPAEPITTIEQTEQPPISTKSWDASVFPAKRKSVKKMACNCVIHCICGKCFNSNNKPKPKPKVKTLLSPKPTPSLCSCSPPPHSLHAAGNYGNKTNGAFWKGKIK